uniref:Bactericidal permeability-increasing protein n=1 Tax=Anolis carolinensis TaxID=28377 RepID=H9GJV6_ANOCA
FSQICDEVSSSVSSQLQPFLQSLPGVTSIFGFLAPQGEFFSLTHRSCPPFPPPALDFPVDHDRMLYFGLSTFFFNTAGNVYYEAGAMNFTITDDMARVNWICKHKQNVFFALHLQLEKLYPDMLMMLKVSPSAAPSLTITPEVMSLSPDVDVQAFVILPNSTMAPLFVLDVVSSPQNLSSVYILEQSPNHQWSPPSSSVSLSVQDDSDGNYVIQVQSVPAVEDEEQGGFPTAENGADDTKASQVQREDRSQSDHIQTDANELSGLDETESLD